MATIQFGKEDFGSFSCRTVRETRRAVREKILPQLTRLSVDLVPALSTLAGRDLAASVGVRGSRERPVQEAFVAFGVSPKDYRRRPHFTFAVSRAGVHARVTLAAEAPAERARFAEALERDVRGLARRYGSLVGLRSYAGDAGGSARANGKLPPEVTPEKPFWESLVAPLRSPNGEVDLGFGWPASRARALALIEVLTAFERLAPIYRIMENPF